MIVTLQTRSNLGTGIGTDLQSTAVQEVALTLVVVFARPMSKTCRGEESRKGHHHVHQLYVVSGPASSVGGQETISAVAMRFQCMWCGNYLADSASRNTTCTSQPYRDCWCREGTNEVVSRQQMKSKFDQKLCTSYRGRVSNSTWYLLLSNYPAVFALRCRTVSLFSWTYRYDRYTQ